MGLLAGHIIKYKDANGNWISIPVLTSDIYNAYVQYCKDNGIDPVTQDVYYQTLGSLQTLVSQLAGSGDAMAAIATALGAGALPTSMGGLGVTISDSPVVYVLTNVKPEDFTTNYSHYYKIFNGEYVNLTEAEAWVDNTYYSRRDTDFQGTLFEYLTSAEGLGLAVNADVNDAIATMHDTLLGLINLRVASAEFDKGIYEPTPNTAGTYYFQYKN